MFAASWFHWSKGALTTALSKSIRRKSFRRPTHSRLSLECLEERVVPDATSTNVLGVINNASLMAFNTQQSSVALPSTTNTAQLVGFAVGVFPSASVGSLTTVSLAAGIFATPSVTGQGNALGINNLIQQGLSFSNPVPNFLQPAFGFGSGTQPAQPWVPNAYNLGLANNQAAYPTVADQGFQTPAPWIRQVAHLQRENTDTNPLNEQLVPPRVTFLVAKESAKDDNPADEISADEDPSASFEEPIASDTHFEARPISLIDYLATEMENREVVAARPSPSPALSPSLSD